MSRVTFTDPDGGIDVDLLPSPRPCPFCGNDATAPRFEGGRPSPIWIYARVHNEETGRLAYYVQCVRCHCEGPMELSADCAARSWNGRSLAGVDLVTHRERSVPGVSLH